MSVWRSLKELTLKASDTPEWEKCNLVEGPNGISTWRVKEKCAPRSYEFCGLKIHVGPFTWQILCLHKHKYLHILVERCTCIMISQKSLQATKNFTKFHISSSWSHQPPTKILCPESIRNCFNLDHICIKYPKPRTLRSWGLISPLFYKKFGLYTLKYT
jgi:hypothetical protein